MTHDLRVHHVYDAAPEVVFDAFTDPRAQQEMYADEPDWIVRSECDLRVGGRWMIEFGPPDGRPSREMCVFEVVDRPRRLVFRSTMVLPDGSSVDTRTYVTFAGTADGRTRLTVVQTGFPAEDLRDEWTDAQRAGSGAQRAGRREWIGLAVLALPCLLYAMDLTVLNLAVPAISRSLRPSGVELLWIVDIYGFALLVTGSVVFSVALAPVDTMATDLALAAAPPDRAGAVTAITETSAEVGGALGIALLGVAGTAVYRSRIAGTLPAGVAPHAARAAHDTLGGAVAAAGRYPAGSDPRWPTPLGRRSGTACIWRSRSAPGSRSRPRSRP